MWLKQDTVRNSLFLSNGINFPQAHAKLREGGDSTLKSSIMGSFQQIGS